MGLWTRQLHLSSEFSVNSLNLGSTDCSYPDLPLRNNLNPSVSWFIFLAALCWRGDSPSQPSVGLTTLNPHRVTTMHPLLPLCLTDKPTLCTFIKTKGGWGVSLHLLHNISIVSLTPKPALYHTERLLGKWHHLIIVMFQKSNLQL